MRLTTPPTPGQLDRAGVMRVQQRSGFYYSPPFGVNGANTANNEILKVMPLIIGQKCTIDRLGIGVAIVGNAGSVVRLGMYADSGNFTPGALLVDGGTVTGDGLGNKEVTVAVPVGPGLVWLAACSQNGAVTAPSLTGYTNPMPWVGMSSLALMSANVGAYGLAGVSGALPADGSTFVSQGSAYKVMARISIP